MTNQRNGRPVIGVTGDYSVKDQTYFVKGPYLDAVRLGGGVPLILEPPVRADALHYADVQTIREEYALETEMLGCVDGILFTGGDDVSPHLYGEEPIRENGETEPCRDVFEAALLQEAMKRKLPIFGICRGIQLLSAALGVKLIQDIYAETKTRQQHSQKSPSWYGSHEVKTAAGSRLAALLGPQAAVNSFHHQAISREHYEGLKEKPFQVTAFASDGLIEGIEIPDYPYFVAVQWHPERMLQDKKQAGLFTAFVKACAEQRGQDE